MSERQKPWGITREELDLRWDMMEHKITEEEFDRRYAELKKAGKVIRSGKAVRE